MTTIANQLIALDAIKTNIKQALETKGVTVGNAPFSSYPSLMLSDTPTWVRPSDWLAMPVVGGTDQKFVGLHAVFPDANFVALIASGAYTVNWGDGTVENFAAGVQANHIYDYTNPALDGTECSRGYKQAIVTVTPQSGQQFTAIDINKKHTTAGLQMYTTGWLDIVVGSPYFSYQGLIISSAAGGVVVNKHLVEHVKVTNFGGVTLFGYAFYFMHGLAKVELASTSSITTMAGLFGYCYSLVSVPWFDTSKITSSNYMFSYCVSLQTVPLYDLGLVYTAVGMFDNCAALSSAPAFNLVKCTTTNNMFGGCRSLVNVSLITLSVVTDISAMFYNCFSLPSVPLFNFSTVTIANNLFSYCHSLKTVPLFNFIKVTSAEFMFYNCYTLQRVPLFDLRALVNAIYLFNTCSSLSELPAFNFAAVTGISGAFSNMGAVTKFSATGLSLNFNLSNAKLSAAALNEVYTNLPVVTGKTLTVTGNWGAAASNTAIAITKGWTVVV